jgi:hypothetical protein
MIQNLTAAISTFPLHFMQSEVNSLLDQKR